MQAIDLGLPGVYHDLTDLIYTHICMTNEREI